MNQVKQEKIIDATTPEKLTELYRKCQMMITQDINKDTYAMGYVTSVHKKYDLQVFALVQRAVLEELGIYGPSQR